MDAVHSGPSRGCEAIRNKSSDGLRWLLMERTRKRSALEDESHRQRPIPRGLLGSALLLKPSSGWVGSKELEHTAFFFYGFAVPDVSEPASQLLGVQLANSLFAQEALL